MVEALLGRRSVTRETRREHHNHNHHHHHHHHHSHLHQTIAMYNMNSTSLLTVPGGSGGGVDNATTTTGVTPRTPEILNSLMAMTNPFEMARGGYPRVASSPPSDTTSSSSSPPSVQATRSQLIKEGLKLTIQTKRKANCSSSSVGRGGASPPSDGFACLTTHSKSDDISMDSIQGENSGDGLTPEDEERRRRRRERNKIAATKCRLKKRERTVNLVQESEILETQNHDLKSQIKELENQRRKLVDMLSGHRPSCSKHTYTASTSSYQEPSTSYLRCNNNSVIESTSSAYTYPTAGPSTSSSSSSYHKVSCESTTVAYHRNSGTSSGGASAVYESGTSYHQRSTTYVQQQGSITPSSSSTLNRGETSGGGMPSYHTHLHGPPHHQTTPADSSPYMRVTGGGGDNSSVYTSLSSVASSSNGSSSTGGSTAGACSAASGNSPIMFIPSPSTPQYNRPSSLGIITTSSSDYESNTELLDSPSIPPTNYHHFDDETAGAYTAGFPTSSCIS